jgi:hypothetical protein
MRVVRRYKLLKAQVRRWWRLRGTTDSVPVPLPQVAVVEDIFDTALERLNIGEPKYVEVVTKAFRGTAKNFSELPVYAVAELQAGKAQGHIDFRLYLFTAELSFTDDDYDRLAELNRYEFREVWEAWASAGQEGKN